MSHSTSERRAESETPGSWLAACAEAVADGEPLRIEVYARSKVPEFGVREYYDRVTSRIEDLVRNGPVTDYRIEAWGKHLRIEEGLDDEVSWQADKVAELRSWAREASVGLPFEVRQCRSSIIDEAYAVLVPPHLLVAVYGEDDLYGVAPVRDGEQTVSLQEFLDLLDGLEEFDERPASASV